MLILGDCLEKLKDLKENSVDAVVTDPPYGLEFMGKEWDKFDIKKSKARYQKAGVWQDVPDGHAMPKYQAGKPFQDFCYQWSKEVLRVLKPGGYLLSFGGTRTCHRMTCAIEDAGFEIRDMIAWVYGSGFPKSHNIGKAVDKLNGRNIEIYQEIGRHIKEKREQSGYTLKQMNEMFGYVAGCTWWESQNDNNTRLINLKDWTRLIDLIGVDTKYTEIIERIERERELIEQRTQRVGGNGIYGDFSGRANITKGTSEWEGWGSNLKPSLEPITMARKPLDKGLTIAENCLKWGTGGINIDGCRVTATAEDMGDWDRFKGYQNSNTIRKNMVDNKTEDFKDRVDNGVNPQGRFPANLILDGSDEVVELFPNTKTQGHWSKTKTTGFGKFGNGSSTYEGVGEKDKQGGSAARFFYCAKSSKRERNMGCEGMEEKQTVGGGGGIGDYLDDVNSASGKYGSEKAPAKNIHPTCKPLKLMEYLVKLVSRENATVLDPFCGSGTTGMACKKLKRKFIGIEKEKDYFKIAEARIKAIPTPML